MVTQRSVSLLFACMAFCTTFHSSPVPAQSSHRPTDTIAVGLLSARDEKPLAVVEAVQSGESLSVTLVSPAGTVTRQVLSGEVFLALEKSGAAADHRPGDRGGGAGDAGHFSVQAGSYGSEDAAERFAAEVRGHWPETEVWVAEAQLGEGRTAYRVMAGRFSDRNRALAFTGTLAAYGMDGAFVVETGRYTSVDGGLSLILYNRGSGLLRDLQQVTLSGVASDTDDGGASPPAFRLDGTPYRGALEVRGGVAGIIAVNRVSLEDYLLGVVPCELGPDKFPLLEALKAQAVSARTYALRHAGRHRGEGFDLCDTPHCQVYGGAGREKPLSSKAVIQTAGLAAFFQGELAETLYTSTCGGWTEISSAVFSGEAPPYLTGVSCSSVQRNAEVSIPQRLVRPATRFTEVESGGDLGFALGLLAVLDIIKDGEVAGGPGSRGEITRAEAGQWIGRFVSRYGLEGSAAVGLADDEPIRPLRCCDLALQVCLALGWSDRLNRLFSAADLDDILGTVDGCGDAERRALAYLLTTGIFHRHPNGGTAAAAPVSRGRFAAALSRLAEHLEPGLFSEAALSGAAGGRLVLRTGEKVVQREIAPEGIRIFERRQETIRDIPATRLRSGDRVLVHYDRLDRVDIMVRLPAQGGAAADRYSPYAFWSIVVDRETIESLLQKNGHRVGRLIDLQPLERGASGRLIRLRAVGTAGETELRGLDIRWNLATRENLFFIDRVKSADGLNRGYRFTGRGWGHGVGMCQVGAAGLAETGATFIEILEHYYPGIRIAPASGARSAPTGSHGP